MEVIKSIYTDLSLGTKMYLSSVSNLFGSQIERLVKSKKIILASAAVIGLGSSAIGCGIFMAGQTESEQTDIATEANNMVEGFDYVSSLRHAELGRPPTAKIVLDNGDTCHVQYSQNDEGFLNLPWGAEVTDWGDCPIKQVKQED